MSGPAAPYYRKLAWASSSFAFLADLALASLGGTLKRKEKITGRFADIFSWLYLGNAVLTRFEKEGRLKEDEPFLHWAMQYAFWQMQQGFDGLYANLDVPGLRPLLRGPIALWSRLNAIGAPPEDGLSHRVAQAMQVPGAQRDRHTTGIFVSDDPEDALGRLERALRLCTDVEDVERRIREAVKAGTLPKARPEALVRKAVAAGVITEQDAARIAEAEDARNEAIRVDSFTLDEYLQSAAVLTAAAETTEPADVSPAPAREDATRIGVL